MTAPTMIPVEWVRVDEHAAAWRLVTRNGDIIATVWLSELHGFCAGVSGSDSVAKDCSDLLTAVATLSERLGVDLPEPRA